MKISAVISEFNPLHSGHIDLFRRTRENGSTHIISVMSGNFVQRGDCAIYSKWDRALEAVKNGVDLVVELPSAKAVSSASNFAFAGVDIADKCGCIDELFFGSECADIEKLNMISEILLDEKFVNALTKIYSEGFSYPTARKMAFEHTGKRELSDILDNPNDILAIEYIKSLKKLRSEIKPICFQRKGEMHDSLNDKGDHLSSNCIRQKLLSGELPPKYPIHTLKNAEKAVLYKLRQMSSDELKSIADVDEGLENRLKESINNSNSIEEIIENCKTKRYTYSRLRRIIVCSLLSISRQDLYAPVSYIKVLAFNERGREVLKIMKDTAKLPVIQKYSDILKIGDEKVIRDYQREVSASDVYALLSKDVECCGREQRENAIFIKIIDK